MAFQPLGDRPLRLAMLGMVEGNGHPYSWSAIFNGFDDRHMARCPYPVIHEYLSREPAESLRIPNANVTHIWTDDPADAPRVAAASRIPHVVSKPQDVIGHVDAAVIATDIGGEHVDRARPFVQAGLPVFIDKPLADNVEDLQTFRRWRAEGRIVLSSSCMRYAKEFLPWQLSTAELGALRFVTATTPKTWERYGIHALEAVYPILGPGFTTCRNTGDRDRSIVHFKHRSGAEVVIAAICDMYGAFGAVQICGTGGVVQTRFQDTFFAFKAQLAAFVDFLRTGREPLPFSETDELVRMVAAGILSRERGGAPVDIETLGETP